MATRGAHLIGRVVDPEKQKALLEKARLARVAKAAARVGNPLGLKLEYADETHWADLATKHGVKRMPSKEDQVDAPTLRKFIGKLDIPYEAFYERFTSVKYFVDNNPKWTKYAAVGMLLELKEELDAVPA